MKEAESFVFLAYYPLFLVELDIYDVFRVLAIVNRIIVNSCRLYSKW